LIARCSHTTKEAVDGIKIASFLLLAGADKNSQNLDGKTPIEYARIKRKDYPYPPDSFRDNVLESMKEFLDMI